MDGVRARIDGPREGDTDREGDADREEVADNDVSFFTAVFDLASRSDSSNVRAS